MNRQRYRLVFNRPRGQWMAVAEIASGLRPHGGSACGGTATAGLLPSVLRFSLLAVSVALTMNTVAHAQILGDRNAPRNQQPTVLVTPNGVPVVNIQTPSTAGVSLNSYRQFDVGARGAILNNARSTTATQLGGYVAGNPWLATGAARVIVNQVNSANPSYLRGYLEVAGARAQVVVANAAGISCAGCGFLNASRATLTTGVPQIVSGQLESYRVARGAVRIEGNGMDGSRTDYAEIIARAVQVNAGIWAPELKVSTGLNTVSADHTSVVPGVAATEAAPAVAIDVPQLGGMYAGHIYLSATEHGVGVRNAGAIGASVGQAVVTADGRLENSGSLTAKGLLTVQTSDGISNTGELGSQSAARLATSALDNRGSIVSAGALNVQASGALQNSGSIGGEGKVQMSAASIDNRSSIGSSTDLALQASADMRNSGQVKAAQSVDLKVGSLDNSGGLIRSDATVHVQAAVLRNDDTLAKDQGMEGATVSVAAAEISNRQGAMRGDAITLVADSRIDNQGGLISAIYGDNVAVGADVLNNQAETVDGVTSAPVIAARKRLDIGAGVINNSEHALIYSVGDMVIGGALDTDKKASGSARELNNSSATINAEGNLTIAAGTLNNTNAHLETTDQTRPGKWLDYFYRDPGTNESIFNDARAKAGIYPNVTPYESLTPVGMQWSRFFSVVDSIVNSSLATGTYLGATLAGASADTVSGALGCGPSAGTSCALVPVGVYVAKASSDQAQEGGQAAFGTYVSTEGRRVLDSFDIATYPGERDPLAQIGIDAGKLGLTYLLGKYIPGGLAKAEEKALSKGSSGTSPEISKTSEEIEALRKIAGNPNGADLSNKAPNTVLNQKAVQDIFDGTLPGTPIDPKRPWTPRQMPESSNPSATAEDFALRVLGRNPTAEELARGSAMNKGNCQGCWYAKNADDIIVTYRPAGYASKDTLPSTATVELNGANTINKLNVDDNGRATIIKLKFPLQ